MRSSQCICGLDDIQACAFRSQQLKVNQSQGERRAEATVLTAAGKKILPALHASFGATDNAVRFTIAVDVERHSAITMI